MRLSQFIDKEPRERSNSGNKRRFKLGGLDLRAIVAHRSFVPMITIWGAALLGLAVLVLPSNTIARLAMLTGSGPMGGFAQTIFAAIAALVGAALGFFAARTLSRSFGVTKGYAPLAATVLSKRAQPIDPARELGSESLDSPINEIPFGAEIEEEQSAQSEAGEEQPNFTREHFRIALLETCEGSMCESVACEAENCEPEPCEAAPDADRPVELDLGEFAELPGRNAVWVEEESPADESAAEAEDQAAQSQSPLFAVKPATATAAAATPKGAKVPAASALEQLRQKHPEELSLVEMVERFAGALHEHQQSERARHPAGAPARDAALAEALKALTLFTRNGFDAGEPGTDAAANLDNLDQTERELREAMAKLQTLRGAA